MAFLYVALDYPDFQHVYQIVRLLDGIEGDFGYKLNLDFIVSNPNFKVTDLETSRPIFADMKMWNGVRTMTEVCRSLHARGFGLTNIHSLCGIGMMKNLMEIVKIFPIPRIKVLGVTVLTHYDSKYCTSQFGRGIELEVIKLARDSVAGGLDGIILPGPFLSELRGVRTLKLVPAVRPKHYQEKRVDQKQTISASDATKAGAELLVCGSPITKSEVPRLALENLLGEIKASSSTKNLMEEER